MVKEKLCWEERCAVLHCWRKARRERCPCEDALLSHPAFLGGNDLLGVGDEKSASKTPPRAREKKRREKEGEKRWGVCGHVRRRENTSGPGVSKEPSQGQAAPGATGQTKASPTKCYQVRKFLIFFT